MGDPQRADLDTGLDHAEVEDVREDVGVDEVEDEGVAAAEVTLGEAVNDEAQMPRDALLDEEVAPVLALDAQHALRRRVSDVEDAHVPDRERRRRGALRARGGGLPREWAEQRRQVLPEVRHFRGSGAAVVVVV